MSKITYSQSISQKIIDKISALDRLDTKSFFDNDEEFLVALCLTYMVFVKEKIIDKDTSNTHPLDRLTKLVDEKEIKDVFDSNFASRMPTVNGAQRDFVWVLDNFRDSVSHCHFEIDEENKMIELHNTMINRELEAKIPFEWLIAYAKNDILKQRMTKYTYVNSVFWNKKLLNQNDFNTMKSINKTIVYSAFAVSKSKTPFNMLEVEQRVKNLLYQCSMMDFSDSELKKYEQAALNYKYSKQYDLEYLEAFLCSIDIVKQTLANEYPDLDINININENKKKIRRRASKLPKTYNSYSIMCNEFSRLVDRKSFGIVRYLSQLIECFERKNFINYDTQDAYEKMSIFSSMFSGNYKIDSNKDVIEWFSFNYPLIQSLLISVYGLNALVINHEDHYHSEYKGLNPMDFGIDYKEKKNNQFFEDRINPVKTILENKCVLLEKKWNLARVRGKLSVSSTISSDIQHFESIIATAQMKLDELNNKGAYILDAYTDKKKLIAIDKLYNHIMKLTKKFEDLDIDVDKLDRKQFKHRKQEKNRYKDIILKLQGIIDTIEKECFFNSNCTMEDVMTIMRNCFAHPGRVTYTIDKDGEPILVLNDYYENEKTGQIIIHPEDFFKLINEPLQRSFGPKI